MGRGKEITENAWAKAEGDKTYLRWKQNAADLQASERRVRAALKEREAERAALDLNDPLAAERTGRLGVEIEAHRAVIAGIENAIGDAQEKAEAAFRAARLAGVQALRKDEMRAKDKAIAALEKVLALADELSAIHAQMGHLAGDVGAEFLDESLLRVARSQVNRWREMRREYPQKFEGLEVAK